MTTPGQGLTIQAMAEAILAAVQEHYADASVALPDRQYVAAGDPSQLAWDCEQLTVGIQGIGWGQAPSAGTAAPKMGTQISASAVRHAIFIVALVRCTPTDPEDPDTGLPSEADLHAAGLEYMRDMGLLSQALVVACARVRAGLSRSSLVEAGAVNPDGPSGGFHGMSAQIAVTAGDLS
jgi:hypothetical protein